MAAPTVIGATYAGYQTGWQLVFDYLSGLSTSARRVRIMQGPVATLDAQMAVIEAAYACESIEPTVSPGSAVATIRAVYSTASGTLPTGEYRWPVYSVYASMICVDLKAHPELASISADMPFIDRLIAEGRITDISTIYAANATALKYARLCLAGVTSYEAPGFNLAVTRYYTSTPSIATDYAQINQIFTWATISTDGKSIPASVDEPKYILPTGSATGYEWRLISVAPVIQRGQINTVQWQFQGLERWAKWLYKNGTWEPASL